MREKQARPLNQSPTPESAVCRKPQASQFGNECASWTSERSNRGEMTERSKEKEDGKHSDHNTASPHHQTKREPEALPNKVYVVYRKLRQ